jgi:hypothetical protein
VSVSVIMPTTRTRPREVVARAVESVHAQTYPHWRLHIIQADGYGSAEPLSYVRDDGVDHYYPGVMLNGWGGAARQWALDHVPNLGTYLVHLDDDNLLFPRYMERLLRTVDSYEYVSCDVFYFGMGEPHVLRGGDLRVGKVDTLSVMVRQDAMRSLGWHEPSSYYSDGITYEALAAAYEGAYLPEVLAAHL